MSEPYLNINPVPPQQPEEPEGFSVTPRPSRFTALLKNALTFLLLILIVLASFWISFQLGRRVLMPAEKIPGPPRIEAPVPETPESIKALQKLQAAVSAEAKKRTAPKKIAPPLTAAQRTTTAYRRTKPGYFKVQAGWFADREQAQALADKLEAADFEVYIRKASGGWRVQAGAFRVKSQAETLKQALLDKGFKPRIIFE
jgi:cell division protein FtsN